jgi:nitrogen fixation NifU-like protein
VSELTDLYQELILDHNRRPRNYGAMTDATDTARGDNPLCGDKLTLYLRRDGDRIAAVSFEGSGCAISKASASLMTEAVTGRTTREAQALFDRVHALITGAPDPGDPSVSLGKLEVLSGVREFPMRVKCASLAWHTLRAALHDSGTPATTE